MLELESYLATPDDEVARKLRESLMPESFEKLGLIILYTENIEKAQDAKTFALLPSTGEARRQERERMWNKLSGMFAFPEMVIPMNLEILRVWWDKESNG